MNCGGGCSKCNYGTFQGPKTPDACKYECCGSLGKRGFEEPFCVKCVSKIKHFNHPQHETTMCDDCEEPTCQYCEPLCCSESPFATPETLAKLAAYEKKQEVLRAKEELAELALEEEQERQEAEERKKEVADVQVLQAVLSRLQSAKVRSAVEAMLPADYSPNNSKKKRRKKR